jgi:hypothetical protein
MRKLMWKFARWQCPECGAKVKLRSLGDTCPACGYIPETTLAAAAAVLDQAAEMNRLVGVLSPGELSEMKQLMKKEDRTPDEARRLRALQDLEKDRLLGR